MRLLQTIAELRSILLNKRQELKIGLVPTMGALHLGHASLIERAISENDFVIVTIFVNPLQFAPTEDLAKYPRQLDRDCQLCKQLGVDLVFAPTTTEMGIDSTGIKVVPPPAMTSILCGFFRPGHFEGVATIVTKLFNIVQPDTAYFGQKDAQQLAIIRRLVADLNIPVEIKACSTVREASGLAYSSRNQYLTKEEKEQALALSRSLRKARDQFLSGETDATTLVEIVKEELAVSDGVKIQYVELVHPQSLKPLTRIDEAGLLAIACYIGSTRLIDNVILRQPIIAIDGPAGAGKSTVTRRVAQALELLYLDTGAMYRAFCWLMMQSGISIGDERAIAQLIEGVKIDLIPADSPNNPTRVFINGEDVTGEIRTPEVTANVSTIAAIAVVRQELVKQQQRIGEKGGLIAEGRDIGTNVFPDAELKIFLTASVEKRARRRLQDFKNQGLEKVDLKELEREIQERDYKDSNRKIAPLKKAVDAIEIITDDLTIEEVTDKIIDLYKQKLSVL